MKRDDPGQRSLFDLEEPYHIVVENKPASPVIERTLDFGILKKGIIEHNAEPHVTATAACKAMRYGEVIHFREFIKRLDKTEEWGLLSYHTMSIRSGKGRRHYVDEPILTEKQLVIVCMQSRLPNMAAVRSQIADVFLAWKHGRLIAADAETETKLLDATDRAITAAPELMDALAALAANDNKRHAELIERLDTLKDLIKQQTDTGRKDFSKKQKDLYARVLDKFYGGLDPVIGQFKLTDGNGHLLEHPAVELDHNNGLRWDTRTANGWPLSPEAHKLKTSGVDCRTEFDDFQKKRLKLEENEVAADADKQPELF
jgi:hypothetical protein